MSLACETIGDRQFQHAFSSTPAGMALTTSDLGIVQDAVFDARAKWYETGLQLGVPPSSLDSIRTDGGSNSEKLRETLKVWLETAPKPTWQNILDALRNRAVGELSLAESVEANYCHTTAEIGGHASGQVMPGGTQLQYIQELERKLQDSERQKQQLVQQIEEQNNRKAETQQRKQWLQKISILEQEKQEACEKMEAGEKQIHQLKKVIGGHEETKKRLEEQVQHFQQKAEEYQRKIEILKETREKSVVQLKCTIDEQRRQLHKLESRLEEEINNKKQLQEQLQEVHDTPH